MGLELTREGGGEDANAATSVQTVKVVHGHPSRVEQREAGSRTARNDGIAVG